MAIYLLYHRVMAVLSGGLVSLTLINTILNKLDTETLSGLLHIRSVVKKQYISCFEFIVNGAMMNKHKKCMY